VRSLSFVRDVFIAREFGTSRDLDVYLLALTLPLFFVVVVTESLGATLVPAYLRTRRAEGQQAASELVARASGLNLVLLGTSCLVVAIGADGIARTLAPDLGTEAVGRLAMVLRLFVPLFLCAGVAGFWTALVNAHERFWVVGLAPAAVPIGATIGLLQSDHASLRDLALGTVVGFAAQAVIVSFSARRCDLSLWPRLPAGPHLRVVLHEYWPMIGGALLMSSTMIVDQVMAVRLGPASVSTLHFGNRVVALLTGAGGAALGTAAFPRLASLAASGELGTLRAETRHLLKLVFLGTTPVVLMGVLVSKPMTSVLFQRGEFSGADAIAVSRVQQLLLLQLPFYYAGILLSRVASALQANRILLVGAVVSLAVNISLNLLFMQWWGVAGIALSTSCVYVVGAGLLAALISRRVRRA
jgi:putative peptidoglycan lipid II flippase